MRRYLAGGLLMIGGLIAKLVTPINSVSDQWADTLYFIGLLLVCLVVDSRKRPTVH